MTWFHALQIAFAALVLGVIAERARFLLYTAALDRKPWLRALLDALDEQDLATATALTRAARPALIAEVAHAALVARSDGDPPGPAIDEAASLAEERATGRLRALRIFASIGSIGGLLGAAIEISRLFARDYGLAALQAGRAESIALGNAVLSVALGTGVALVAFTAARVLGRAARALISDIRETSAKLHESLTV